MGGIRMLPIPKKFFVTSGKAVSKISDLNAFDEALPPTVDGQSYVAEVYTDDGDGVFDAAKDLLVTNPSGAALSVPFTATKDLPEIKG